MSKSIQALESEITQMEALLTRITNQAIVAHENGNNELDEMLEDYYGTVNIQLGDSQEALRDMQNEQWDQARTESAEIL